MSYDLSLVLVDPSALESELAESKNHTIDPSRLTPVEFSPKEKARLLHSLVNDMSLSFPNPEWDTDESETIELIYENADKAFRLFIDEASIGITILSIDDLLFDVVDQCINSINARGDYLIIDPQRREVLLGQQYPPLKHRVKHRLEAMKNRQDLDWVFCLGT